MMNSKPTVIEETERFRSLVDKGILSAGELQGAAIAADRRGLALEWILRHEYDIPRRTLLMALAEHYGCPWIEYDERRPVPPELLAGLDGDRLCAGQWFPVIKAGETVVIAARNPHDPLVADEVHTFVRATTYEFRVALGEDIRAHIHDFLNGPPEHLIGNERTGLAYWRNTMARWRTRLACYRTDFAKVRTNLGLLEGGLGLIAIARTLMLVHRASPLLYLYWLMIGIGFALVGLGLYSYRRIKTSVLRPPKPQTLVEVTAATLYFLELYQFAEEKTAPPATKGTMLARLVDSLPNQCVFIAGSPDNKVRSALAHERNLLAAQRTLSACYRTIYARARTGLSFVRSGVAFASIGLGLIEYFGFHILTILDCFLIGSGVAMIIDGALWYLPVRKEQAEVPKYLMPA
ncbi:MAG TPA: type II secretion protein [Syntrophobacteria bacterium]|nr:type II secretion protein [Syntrophobacteria bacterium]